MVALATVVTINRHISPLAASTPQMFIHTCRFVVVCFYICVEVLSLQFKMRTLGGCCGPRIREMKKVARHDVSSFGSRKHFASRKWLDKLKS